MPRHPRGEGSGEPQLPPDRSLSEFSACLALCSTTCARPACRQSRCPKDSTTTSVLSPHRCQPSHHWSLGLATESLPQALHLRQLLLRAKLLCCSTPSRHSRSSPWFSPRHCSTALVPKPRRKAGSVPTQGWLEAGPGCPPSSKSPVWALPAQHPEPPWGPARDMSQPWSLAGHGDSPCLLCPAGTGSTERGCWHPALNGAWQCHGSHSSVGPFPLQPWAQNSPAQLPPLQHEVLKAALSCSAPTACRAPLEYQCRPVLASVTTIPQHPEPQGPLSAVLRGAI